MRTIHGMCLGLAVALGLGISACGGSDVGKACDADADCGDGLSCDEHDGKGTCQEPHGHEAGEETAHEDTEHHHTSTGPTTGEDTVHGGTMEDTDHHDTEDTEHHDTEDTEDTGGTDDTGDTGGTTG